ncbi:hypothetical protein T4D_10645 [Trichinella pseudospiralis]|uniref:Uncharacterized protein n=1 Tax=Trichinella pseudospiralis TaxID=6337 RepID=A0A0V1G2P7_TRIPS|nr:hypothetical protein T4D_10645 [Trichinella pseudospiralis]
MIAVKNNKLIAVNDNSENLAKYGCLFSFMSEAEANITDLNYFAVSNQQKLFHDYLVTSCILLDKVAGKITENCMLKCYHQKKKGKKYFWYVIAAKFNQIQIVNPFLKTIGVRVNYYKCLIFYEKQIRASENFSAVFCEMGISELVGVTKRSLVEAISRLTYVKGDLKSTSLNKAIVEIITNNIILSHNFDIAQDKNI